METKICTKCNIEKELTEFYKNSSNKDGLRSECDLCTRKYRDKNKEIINKKQKDNRRKSPWKVTLVSIKQRCNNPKNQDYERYGKRGIKCLITSGELKVLWFRDKAYNMKQPSIDRIENDGNYELSNCQFLEMLDNSKKGNCKITIQYDLEGNFIKEWKSTIDASKELKIDKSSITKCCLKKIHYITAGGFKWRYKCENGK